MLAECPPTKGILGRLMGLTLSTMPNDELRLPAESKTPERFSRKADCRPKAESARDAGVLGIDEDVGDEYVGEGGEFVDELLLPRLVALVDGRSEPLLVLLRPPRNAL